MSNFVKTCSIEKLMKQKILLAFLSILLSNKVFCQSNGDLYTPVTINAPFLNQKNEIQAGANINNYGLNYLFAGKLKNKILIFSVQQNPDNLAFDPLNFYGYKESGESKHLIQSKPAQMFYLELGVGYSLKLNTQKIGLFAGLGQQLINPNTRIYIQCDWGKEGELINAGVSLRGNYTRVNSENLVTLEPVVQGKVKIWNFRIIKQFGYSIALKEDFYMKPILTVGLQYVIVGF